MAEQKMQQSWMQELVSDGKMTEVVRKRAPRLRMAGIGRWSKDEKRFHIAVDPRIRAWWSRRNQTVEA